MKIEQLHHYKREQKFVKISKNDTLYVLPTAKYDVTVEYASSNFYAPDFYYVSVKDKQGKNIWSGNKSMFLDTLFSAQFISNRFDKMILNRVNDTTNPNSQQMILVDLKTGTENTLTGESFFGMFGHFQSFDAVFFYEAATIHCLDFENGKEFRLDQIIAKHFTGYKTWGLCSVKDCIIVNTLEKENNLLLFNIRKEQIMAKCTLVHKAADSVNCSFNATADENELLLTVTYADKAANGHLAYTRTEYFKVSL